MNKMFKVILLSASTAALGFVGCSGGEDIENRAVAGAPASAGTPATTPAAGAPGTAGGATGAAPGTAGAAIDPAIVAGAPSIVAGAPSTTTTGNSGGCSVSYGATSRGALTGLALALAWAWAFAARRRRS